jgi:hypothetical protein
MVCGVHPYPEIIRNCDVRTEEWLISSWMMYYRQPDFKILFKRAKIIAIPKPVKDVSDPIDLFS